MSRNAQTPSANEPKPVSPARGLLFMIGSLSFFYGLITVVDPLL
jgi:hypothetical protein